MDKEPKCSVPAEMQTEINSADIMEMIDTLPPGAQGDDEGVGHPNNFMTQPNHEYIPAESQPVIDENKSKRDSVKTYNPKIGEMKKEENKKKKGFFRKLFGKKTDD